MMNGMDNREQAIENKFAHDQNLDFKVNSKRNRMIASWAAETMQMNDYQAKEYVNNFVSNGVNFVDESQVIDTILEDCQRSFVKIDKDQVKKQSIIFKNQAYHDVMNNS